jgi:hypothetical protein
MGGIDGALRLAALRGDEAAQAISFTWSMRRSRPSTAVRPRRRRPRYWNRRRDRCGPSRRSASKRHVVSPPNSASPFQPAGNNATRQRKAVGENRGVIGALASVRASTLIAQSTSTESDSHDNLSSPYHGICP